MLAVTVFLCLPATTTFAQPYERPAESLEELRIDIAWYGAACLLRGEVEETMDGPVTRESLAEETGVDLDLITGWIEARAPENSIAVDVLLRGGEPLRDPPEPFLTILRQRQADCQNLIRSRRVLEAAIDRGALPERSASSAPTPLRAELDPHPFDAERRQRLERAILSVEDVLAAGDYADDIEALLRAIAGRPDLMLGDLRGIDDPDGARRIATGLLLPNPQHVTDLSVAEVQDVITRLEAAPQGPFAAYYAGLVMSNLEVLGQGTPYSGERIEGSDIFVFRNENSTLTCRPIDGSVAIICDPAD
ncbi:hypothetical protein [Hasllibacter sp. MH4015]|uniref:hypothetical protein n=1 Tax=Hasllibacter sp. MH4015 TaxID=2854029 RepID=UPI001CD2EED2|nr:hypothetical protein [Hasllibacter sp. MH4015]